MYPVQSRLVEGLKPNGDASVLVDISGGTGQILQDFRNDVPQYTGRLVLQEIPEVVAAATEKGVGADGRIELQVHDFFTPQPIRGARTYFMRSVLHDWPDEQCRKILAQLKNAMEPGYSKILISDCVRIFVTFSFMLPICLLGSLPCIESSSRNLKLSINPFQY